MIFWSVEYYITEKVISSTNIKSVRINLIYIELGKILQVSDEYI